MPLKPLELGWQANDTTWYRVWIFGVVITSSLLVQAREMMVMDLPPSLRQILITSVTTATDY